VSRDGLDTADILVVDDEQDIRDGCERVLTRTGYRVFKAANGEEALQILEEQSVAIVLLDLKMPGIDGMEVLNQIKSGDAALLVIIITGYATIEAAIEAMKGGAYDFITKPFEPDQLRLVVNRAHERLRLAQEAAKLDQERRRTLVDLDTEKSRTRTIIESLPNGVIVTNSEGQVVLMNRAVLSLLDLNPRRGPGDHITAYIADKELCDLVTGISRGTYAASGDVPTCELTLENEKYLLAEGKPVMGEEKECLGAVVTLLDITAMKRLDRLRSEFVAEVSHELRSPLSTIHEELALVIRDMVAEESFKDQHILSRALDKTQGLITLIGDLLDLSRIEAGHVFQQSRIVHIDELLRSIVEFLEVKARDRSQCLTLRVLHPVPPITADPLALESVFGNLITNAIRYTQDSGTVTVTVELVGKTVQVAVRDNGFGIEAKHLEAIFERFYRVKNEKTRFITGTGLGLPIVKEILDRMGGSINVESTYGEGSTFTVTLPLEGPAETG
jgi:signal transduction histidine kinase